MPIYAAIGPAAYMLAWQFSVRSGGISVRPRTLAWVGGLANAHGVIVLLAAVLLRHADIITSSLIIFFWTRSFSQPRLFGHPA